MNALVSAPLASMWLGFKEAINLVFLPPRDEDDSMASRSPEEADASRPRGAGDVPGRTVFAAAVFAIGMLWVAIAAVSTLIKI